MESGQVKRELKDKERSHNGQFKLWNPKVLFLLNLDLKVKKKTIKAVGTWGIYLLLSMCPL